MGSMDWRGILSFKYREDLNKVAWAKRDQKRICRFFEENGERGIRRGIELILQEIIPADDGEAHLEAFLATCHVAGFIMSRPTELTMLVYPAKGEVKRYALAQEDFFSNVHLDPDPLSVTNIQAGIHLHPTKTSDRVWIPGNLYASNIITAALFYKKNPLANLALYPGFEEFLAYECDPDKRW